jgi:hypothetical protein
MVGQNVTVIGMVENGGDQSFHCGNLPDACILVIDETKTRVSGSAPRYFEKIAAVRGQHQTPLGRGPCQDARVRGRRRQNPVDMRGVNPISED